MTMNMTMTIRATVRQIVLLASLVPTTSELNSLLLTSPILIPTFQFILLTTLVSFPRYLTTVSDVGHHQRSPRNFFGPTYIFILLFNKLLPFPRQSDFSGSLPPS